MPNQGKRVIGTIVTVALLAAGFAWWYAYQHGQRILTLWGPDAAYRIRLAPDCELLTLAPAPQPGNSDLVIDSRGWTIRGRVDLSNAPGFVHARQALIEDSSYRWEIPVAASDTPTWEYAIRFRDEHGETLLVFDLRRSQVLDLDQNRRADIAPIAAGLKTFFTEQIPPIPDSPQ